MEWSNIITAMLGAGLGTAIVEGGISLFQYLRTERSQAAFLALRIASQLEAYARACLGQMNDADNYMSSRGAIGNLHWQLPTFPDYPDDAEGWRNLSSQVMEIAFRLRADAEQHQQGLDFWAKEFGEPDQAFHDCYDKCGTMGTAALNAAQSFRQHYGFSAYTEETKGNIEHNLTTSKRKFYEFHE